MNPGRRAALRSCARGGVLLACASRVALACAAEAARDGRGHPFEDDLIAHLAGRWDLTRTMGNRQVRNSVVADWVLDHQMRRSTTPSPTTAAATRGP